MRFVVTLDLPDQDVQQGWNGDPREVALSAVATLHELIGDDGGAYAPQVAGVDAYTDADVLITHAV